jgi:cellulose synthase/poly-beta-1,6-N-acetylglucosamine synthase-like glycosyltransferase/peptidoglycan/xylan/chitin deacetylase (PgdA/CDA1 family)/spore germination protein YaaH
VPGPVFYDPSARRWRRLKGLALGLGAVVGILLGAVVLSILVNPVLPELGLKNLPQLPQARHLRPGLAQPKAAVHPEGRGVRPVPPKAPPRVLAPAPAPASRSAPFERIGFFVNWDDNSLVSLRKNLTHLDTLMPEWLHLADGAGRLKVDDVPREAQVAALVRAQRPRMRLVPLVNNAEGGSWHGDRLAATLASSVARSHLVEDLYSYVRERGYQGISIDFEAVPRRSQPGLRAFMQELYATFHPAGLTVAQSVPLDDPDYDLKAFAATSDYLIIMAYDEHAADDEPGPIASQRWFTEHVRRRLAELSPGKVVIALGSYGYDWTGGRAGADELSFQDALRVARESSATVEFSAEHGNPGFEYEDEAGRHHDVWYLDAVTAYNEVAAVRSLHPRGFALWRLGSEDPAVWDVLAAPEGYGSALASRLATLQNGYDIDYEGTGEILRVTGTPKAGRRSLELDSASGLIADERIDDYPSGYQITRWGSTNEKRIVLTFDDGPDPAYTPDILDILRARQVPALFFVMGEQGERYPELLARIAAEGHEIGNHTYTHPNIALVGDERLTLEVNAVQRLLESRLGRRSLLFRPPYAEDVEPETPDQVRPLLVTSALGYYTVGMLIDPNDWASPGVDAIVSRVLDAARAGTGHVVLLHDSGGSREQTVAALPAIIDGLRAEGYTLVTLSTLVGLPAEAVNPRLPQGEVFAARFEHAGFSLITWVDRTLWALFTLGLVLGSSRFLITAALALWPRRAEPDGRVALPSVAVVIPAYNERRVILPTVRSVLASDLPDLTLLVVDDGSSDGTAELVRETFAAEPRVRVLRQANTGKAGALNHAFRDATAEVIVALDADTQFRPDTVRLLAAHFADPGVAAVAGCARVGNVVNLITRWQALEYATSQNLDRRAFARLNCITVVPGAVGAWRRSLVLAAGGFATDTVAEDADLTLRLLRLRYRVTYEDRAVAHTEAPERVAEFLKQRFRWMYGTLQAAYKQRDALFRRETGALGSIALPNLFVFQILFPLISPIMDLLLLWTAAHALVGYLQHPLADLDPGFMRALWYYALFTLIDCATALLGFALDREAEWRLLPWLLPQRFFYRQLIYYVALKALVTALRGPRVGWGKLERTATVTSSAPRRSVP